MVRQLHEGAAAIAMKKTFVLPTTPTTGTLLDLPARTAGVWVSAAARPADGADRPPGPATTPGPSAQHDADDYQRVLNGVMPKDWGGRPDALAFRGCCAS